MHVTFADSLAGKDVAIAGLGFGRLDAEGDDAARFRGSTAGKASRAKSFDVQNNVIGGKREHDGLRIAQGRDRRRSSDGGSRIAPYGLYNDGCINAHLLSLPAGEEMKIRTGYDNRRRKHRVPHPQQRFLVSRPVADQWQELLGQGVPRNRPKPGPGAAGQQNGDDW